jgi:hypothetical protein
MHPTLQTLYGYWNEVRAGRVAPQRLEIEPSRIAGILSDTFMLERTAAGTYQYRLAGTRLCELFGSELRGKDFLDGWMDEDRRVLGGYLGAVTQQGATALLTIEGAVDPRHRVELETILLPLLHAGKIVRIIGATSATSAPHWLGAEPLRTRHIRRHQLMWPDGRPHAVVARAGRQAPFQAEAAAETHGLKADKRRFRVFEGGRGTGKHDKR